MHEFRHVLKLLYSIWPNFVLPNFKFWNSHFRFQVLKSVLLNFSIVDIHFMLGMLRSFF